MPVSPLPNRIDDDGVAMQSGAVRAGQGKRRSTLRAGPFEWGLRAGHGVTAPGLLPPSSPGAGGGTGWLVHRRRDGARRGSTHAYAHTSQHAHADTNEYADSNSPQHIHANANRYADTDADTRPPISLVRPLFPIHIQRIFTVRWWGFDPGCRSSGIVSFDVQCRQDSAEQAG
jgi:hypothetical protein